MLRNIRLLYLHNFLTAFCPHWPFQVIYFANIADSYTVAMSVMAVETLAAALFDIPAGIFSDRMGRRLTMSYGSLCMALALICYASANGVATLYIGAVLVGLGQCFFSGNNNALLYESLRSEGLESEYHHYRGRAGSMFQLALATSAFFAIWFSRFGLPAIYTVAIVPQVSGVFVSLLFQEPRAYTHARPKGIMILKEACRKTWKNPQLFWLMIARSINYGAGESNFKFQSVFINMLWPVWAVGLYRGLNHALGFAGFRLAGRVIERFGEPRLFVARDIYWFVTQMLALALNSFVSPLIILSGAFFFGPGEVASDHLMQKEFTDEQRATMASVASFITSIVFAIVALGIGAVSDRFGVTMGLGFGIAVCFLALPVNLWLFRKSFGFGKGDGA